MFGLGRQLLNPKVQVSGRSASVTLTHGTSTPPRHITVSLPRTILPDNTKPNNSALHRNPTFQAPAIESTLSDFELDRTFVSRHPTLSAIKDLIHSDLKSNKFAGSPIPASLEGCRVLNLGCQNGYNTFTCAALVGESGSVIGVDTDQHQIQKAKGYIDFHKEVFLEAFSQSKMNIQFLTNPNYFCLNIESNSIDVIIFQNILSGLNLQEIDFTLKECWRVLKEGGEIIFSDGFANRRISPERAMNLGLNDPFWAELVPSAIYYEDVRRAMNCAGFIDVRTLHSTKLSSHDNDMNSFIRHFGLCTKSIRSFKIKELEDRQEDYNQTALFKGSQTSESFTLDQENSFYLGSPTRISRNTALILQKSRFMEQFEVSSSEEHQGLWQNEGIYD